MEEIDIIELLRRVKEKRAPMIIKAKCTLFILQEIRADDEPMEIGNMYLSEENVSLVDVIDVNTKIKILDKPIINTVDELKKIIKDKDSIFWIGERGLMAIEEAINIIQNKEEK